MKARSVIIILFVLIFIASTAPVGQTSAADKTQVSGTETFDPFNLLGNGPVGEILSLGTVECPGFEPTGNPMQPCPTGSRTHSRSKGAARPWPPAVARARHWHAPGWLPDDTPRYHEPEDAGPPGQTRVELYFP